MENHIFIHSKYQKSVIVLWEVPELLRAPPLSKNSYILFSHSLPCEERRGEKKKKPYMLLHLILHVKAL